MITGKAERISILAYSMAVSRRVHEASYSNQAFEPEVSIISSPPVYAIGGGCALYRRDVSFDMDADAGIALNPTPFYKNWKGKKIKVKKPSQPTTSHRWNRRTTLYIVIGVFLAFVVIGLALGLGLGLGLP